MVRAAWNPAGGIRYHLRALRHRDRAWAPYRAAVATWLAGWDPGTASLAVVGPSGGYCLPATFLARFARLVCFEPDPIARVVFARRLRGGPRLAWVRHDAWIAPVLHGRGPPRGLLPAGGALLFANLLGQAAFLVPEEQWPALVAAWRTTVWPLLDAVPWASLHDRVSGSIVPRLRPGLGGVSPLTDAEVLALYGDDQRGELVDHRAAELLPPGRGYAYFDWSIVPGRHHLIEGVVGLQGRCHTPMRSPNTALRW